MSKCRVLVLGAAGYIGRHVAAALLASDWASPICAYHRSPPATPHAGSVALDATDADALETALLDADAVVNCVAGSPAVIVAGARALFAAAGECSVPPRIVHLSSMAVYGGASGKVDETSPLIGDLGAYSAAKVAAEHFAAQYPHAVVLRPGCVYGRGSSQWSERIARLLMARRLGNLGAAGEGFCNLVYIDDLVAAILQGLRLPGIEGQAFNLSMPAPPTWNHYLLLYAQALRIGPVKRISQTRLAVETLLLAPPLKAADLVLRIAAPTLRSHVPAIPRSLLRLFSQNMQLASGKAEQMLKLSWTPLNEGLTMATGSAGVLAPA